MIKNMGTADRIIRVLVVAVIFILNYLGYLTGTVGIIAGIVGGIFLLTSIISFCPLYKLVGLNTCPAKK